MDITPIITEVLRTQAYIKAFASALLTEEQHEQFKKEFTSSFRESYAIFVESNPNLFSDVDAESLLSELRGETPDNVDTN